MSAAKQTTGTEVDFTSLDDKTQELIRCGNQVRDLAYCPYSKFKVGSALLCDDGSIVDGCNVENACHGSICAERTAIVKAVSSGKRTFPKVAVVAYLPNDYVSPCGPCRQFIAEFGSKTEIYLSNPEMKKVLVTSIQELLPLAFGLKELESACSKVKN